MIRLAGLAVTVAEVAIDHVQAAEHRQEARMIVNIVQVIHDDEEALGRVARPQAPKRFPGLDDALAAPEQPTQAVGMNVVEADAVHLLP